MAIANFCWLALLLSVGSFVLFRTEATHPTQLATTLDRAVIVILAKAIDQILTFLRDIKVDSIRQ